MRTRLSMYGALDIDSAPPQSAIRAEPLWIAWDASITACRPEAHIILTVKAGTLTGRPAPTPICRAMFMPNAPQRCLRRDNRQFNSRVFRQRPKQPPLGGAFGGDNPDWLRKHKTRLTVF